MLVFFALCQGTTSVVPNHFENSTGFSRCIPQRLKPALMTEVDATP
jgi:hypothetical protein